MANFRAGYTKAKRVQRELVRLLVKKPESWNSPSRKFHQYVNGAEEGYCLSLYEAKGPLHIIFASATGDTLVIYSTSYVDPKGNIPSDNADKKVFPPGHYKAAADYILDLIGNYIK